MSLHQLVPVAIDGTPRPLADLQGKVVLVVNTASKCGFTPQYDGLEKLWQEYRDRGLMVLGFPSNDFGRQEPGSESEIAEFCRVNYGVTFPLFEKVVTRGAGKSDIYAFLTARHDEPKWNFSKYLVGKDGEVIRAFGSDVSPSLPELRGAIDAALQA